MWPREDAMQVPGRGGSAEGRAWQWRSGGGRGSSGSGDRAARLDQQAVGAKSALNANHTASRTKLASYAQRANDVPVNFS
jgi:hypothetical protein